MEGDGDTEHANLFYIHGWAMWTSWAVLGYIMIVSNRYLKRFWKVHLWIHGIVGFLIFACTLTMGLLVIKNLIGRSPPLLTQLWGWSYCAQ